MAQSNGNGGSYAGFRFYPPTDTTKFVIGGQDIEVPALTLYAMNLVKDELLSLGPDLDWITYAKNVVHIVYVLVRSAHPELDVSEEEMLKACSLTEMRQLPVAMNSLLGISGFDAGPTEAATAEPGIGISTPSSQTLQPTESVTETSTG